MHSGADGFGSGRNRVGDNSGIYYAPARPGRVAMLLAKRLATGCADISWELSYGVYRIGYSRPALKALKRMPRNVADLIRSKMVELAPDPHATNRNAEKLVDREGYRLRVGDWRVLYQVQHQKEIILVIDIAPRGGIYE